MANNKENGRTRTTDRESVRRKIVEMCQNPDTDGTLFASALKILIERIADSAAIDLVQDDGSMERVVTLHSDGEKQKTLSDHRDGHPLPLTSSYGYPRVIKTGKSQFIPGVNDRITSRLFPNAELVLDGLVVRSFMCVPLIVRGRILGALTLLTTDNGNSFDADDLLFFEEIAGLIAVAHDGHNRAKIASPPPPQLRKSRT